jgi:hypothetical protein
MAIHRGIEKQFLKYLPQGECVISTVYGRTIMGDENDRYCLTRSLVGILHKERLFDWKYSSMSLDQIAGIILDEGTFKSSIAFTKSNKYVEQFDNIDRQDANEFIEQIKGISSIPITRQ